MLYKNYIAIGFQRLDQNDNVEFDRTGYKGFILTKPINDRMSVEVVSGNLENPKLYIKKPNGQMHIIDLTPEAVRDIFAPEPLGSGY